VATAGSLFRKGPVAAGVVFEFVATASSAGSDSSLNPVPLLLRCSDGAVELEKKLLIGLTAF